MSVPLARPKPPQNRDHVKAVLHFYNSHHCHWRNTKRQATHLVSTRANPVAGYDEGGFSASVGLDSFKQDFKLLPELWEDNPSGMADRKANISSFGVLGAAFGSLLALVLTDRIGRLRSWQVFVLLWATGTFIQVFSSGILGLMLFARIWGGLGSGGLTVVAPLYLSEIAPAASRGTIVSIYMVILLSFLTIGTDSVRQFLVAVPPANGPS